MSALPGSGRPRPPARPRRRFLRVLGAIAALLLAFLLGVAFARALDEHPEQGPRVTTVRTVTPLPLQEGGSTVTVTVTAP